MKITVTKIFAFMVSIMGFVLAYKTGDVSVFVSSAGIGMIALGVRKAGNTIIDYKNGRIEAGK